MNGKNNDVQRIHIFEFCGLKVSSFTKDELLNYLNYYLRRRESKVIYGHSLGIFPRLFLQPDTIKYIQDYDLYVSDGYKFHKLGKWLGFPFKYMISLPQITFLILELANKNNLSVFLLGATKDSNEKAVKQILRKYPNVKSCYGIDGYFNFEDEKVIIETINKKNPDILFIGMPSPIKEKFIYRNRNKLKAGIIVLNGGMIDVISGKAKMSPILFKRLGLTLVYRFLQAPKHKFKQFLTYYILILFYFIPLMIIKIKILGKKNILLKDFFLLKKRIRTKHG